MAEIVRTRNRHWPQSLRLEKIKGGVDELARIVEDNTPMMQQMCCPTWATSARAHGRLQSTFRGTAFSFGAGIRGSKYCVRNGTAAPAPELCLCCVCTSTVCGTLAICATGLHEIEPAIFPDPNALAGSASGFWGPGRLVLQDRTRTVRPWALCAPVLVLVGYTHTDTQYRPHCACSAYSFHWLDYGERVWQSHDAFGRHGPRIEEQWHARIWRACHESNCSR